MILAIWWLVAHNSGSGWVQVLGDLAFGTLFVGIIGPALVLARARLDITGAPADAAAGLPVELTVTTGSRLRIRGANGVSGESFIGPRGFRQPAETRVTLVPERRAVLESVTLDIATAAPVALQWWTRRVRLPLPTQLHVAPRRGRPVALPARPRADADVGEMAARAQRDEGEPRGARPYQSGDHRRQVHWRATAHAGEMMVRELEQSTTGHVMVAVVLPRDRDEAERVAEGALGSIARLLDQGTPVLLATRERAGPVVAPVVDRRGAGRRLARAVGQDEFDPSAPGVTVTS
jgi:uncharacterized protein (DUF58 family)